MKTHIFDDIKEFLKREDKTINGVSPQFAIVHPDCEKDNKFNKGCWECADCVGCIDCSNCIDCRDSKSCHYCTRCTDCECCVKHKDLTRHTNDKPAETPIHIMETLIEAMKGEDKLVEPVTRAQDMMRNLLEVYGGSSAQQPSETETELDPEVNYAHNKEGTVWITVGNLSVMVLRKVTGVKLWVLPLGEEADEESNYTVERCFINPKDHLVDKLHTLINEAEEAGVESFSVESAAGLDSLFMTPLAHVNYSIRKEAWIDAACDGYTNAGYWNYVRAMIADYTK